MIKLFVKAWDKNRDKLEEYIRSNEQDTYDSYVELVRLLFREVINPYLGENYKVQYKTDSVHVIDDGNYQGTQIFIIAKDEYQPISDDYVWTCHDYGSCSGCDLLMAISNYSSGKPTEEQVKRYMNLELNLLQNLSFLKQY